MALMNRPMYEHFGARHLAVKGPGAMTTIEEGVMGVLPLDMMSDPAYWFIQGIRTYSVGQEQTASAGRNAQIGISLENATDPVLIRILSWEHEEVTAQVNLYRCARTAFSSDPGVYGYGTDTRIAEAQTSTAVGISADGTSNPGTRLGFFSEDAQIFGGAFSIPLILSPGEAFYLSNNTAGETLNSTIIWAEIPAYKAEL
jgi:hypothetical protein